MSEIAQPDENNIILHEKTFPLFLRYSIPGLIALLIVSSSVIVDGIFAGRFLGAMALGAINVVLPISTIIRAVAMVITSGGAAVCGNYLGRGDREAASRIFTKCLILVTIIGVVFACICLGVAEPLIRLFGGAGELIPLATLYLRTLSLALFADLPAVCLIVFLRLQGKPVVASCISIGCAISNMLLNYLFTVQFGWGMFGIAFSTGISSLLALGVNIVVLATLKTPKFKPIRNIGSFGELWYSIYNGSSEFINNASGALVIAIMNRLVIKMLGLEGMAAFTVMNYILIVSILAAVGISDGLNSMISVNYGAGETKRVQKLLTLGYLGVSLMNLIIFAVLALQPEMVADVFLREAQPATVDIALEYIKYFKYTFLFNGLNIISTVFFTATNYAFPSMVLALCRSLVFPMLVMWYLPQVLGRVGVFLTIPVSEILTFGVAAGLMYYHRHLFLGGK